MGVPCMPVRVKCLVIGRELHGALGTLILPPAPPLPFTPSKTTLWISASTTHYGMGDEPVPNVKICGEKAVQKGADTKYLRPHVTVVGIVPPNVVVGPIIDLGFMVLVIAVGCTKPVWGSTSVKAGKKSVAVMAIPYSPICPFNQLICSDPCDLPIGLSAQMPSSVFIGMSLADYFLCALSIAADMVISLLINLAFGKLKFIGNALDAISSKLLGALGRMIGPKVLGLVAKGLAQVLGRLGRFAPRFVEKFARQAVEETLKKLTGAAAGGLSPDDILGFGEQPPLWAR